MPHNPKLDLYIEKSAPFAQPILLKIREMVHSFCPEATETIKWSFPVFEYRGSNLCHMAAFKNHCAFGFWLSSIMDDPEGILKEGENKVGMGNFGKITSASQLPDFETFRPYFIQAMILIEKGVKLPKKPVAAKPDLVLDDDFKQRLLQNPAADFQFEKMSQSKKREYQEWIYSAKTEKTKLTRMETAIEWISEGKSLNWRYEKR